MPVGLVPETPFAEAAAAAAAAAATDAAWKVGWAALDAGGGGTRSIFGGGGVTTAFGTGEAT